MYSTPDNLSCRLHPSTARLDLLAGCALLLLLAGCTGASEIPLSALKQRITDGQVASVRISETKIQAISNEAARSAGHPERWTATRVPGDDDLVPLLDQAGVEYDGENTGASPLAIGGGVLVGLLVLFLVFRAQRGSVPGLSEFGSRRARRARGDRPCTRLADVAGVDEVKEELADVVEFLADPARFTRIGVRVPRGILLAGPPGTGKTLLARAVAGEAGVPFFSLSGSDFVELYVGVGAARVRKLFAHARRRAPAIVFIDELDAVGKSRGSGPGQNDEREQTLNQLLVEMDGFDARTNVVVLAATNRHETLDPALLRPGRFDRQVLIGAPDVAGRKAILEVHARTVVLGEDVDLGEVARRTPGFTGADLANLLNEGGLLAARQSRTSIGSRDILAAIDRVVAGLEKKSRLSHPKERRIVAYHEAGHALVATLVPNADPVSRISIVPRGFGALGVTQQLPEDRVLLQRDECLDRLAVLLGGRAAELIVFGQVSTGAANDLDRASELARRMILEFGMSEVVAPVSYGADGSARGDGESARDPRIGPEISALIDGAAQRARTLLEERRDALERVSIRLLETETVERDELLALVEETIPAEAAAPAA